MESLKSFLDTSVLVASAILQHPRHYESFTIYSRAEKTGVFCAAHSLAETFATLTVLPGSFRLATEQAMLFLNDACKRLGVVSLNESDYFAAINAAVAEDMIGGTIYDALIARCAIKAGADVIYTWDVADFQRVVPELRDRVRTP